MPDQLGKEDCPFSPPISPPPNHACCTPTSKTVGCCSGEVAGKVLCMEGRRHTEQGTLIHVMWGQHCGVWEWVCWGDTVPSGDSFSAGSGKEAVVGHCSLLCIPLEPW